MKYIIRQATAWPLGSAWLGALGDRTGLKSFIFPPAAISRGCGFPHTFSALHVCRGSSLNSPRGEAQTGKAKGPRAAPVARTEECSGERVLWVLQERTRTGMVSLEERKMSHLSDILPESFLGTMMGFEFACRHSKGRAAG